MFCLQGAENGSNAVNVYQVGQLMQIFPLYNFYNFEGCPGTKLSHVKFLKLRIERARSYQGRQPSSSQKKPYYVQNHIQFDERHIKVYPKKPLIALERFGTFLEGNRKKVSRNIALLERPECGHGAQIFICVWARSILHMVALKRLCGATSTISYAGEDWWSTCSEPVDASWHMCMITSDLVSNYVWLKTMCY